ILNHLGHGAGWNRLFVVDGGLKSRGRLGNGLLRWRPGLLGRRPGPLGRRRGGFTIAPQARLQSHERRRFHTLGSFNRSVILKVTGYGLLVLINSINAESQSLDGRSRATATVAQGHSRLPADTLIWIFSQSQDQSRLGNVAPVMAVDSAEVTDGSTALLG